MFDWISNPEAWVALLTLSLLEIVLGIDNIIFISILSDKLPEAERGRARTLGLGVAMITRVLLLFGISWVMRLTTPLFAVFGHGVSGRDLILISGGLFLLFKATREIHHRLESADESQKGGAGTASFGAIILQIALLDIVFSLDSVITAVGMADDVGVMITAVVLAVAVMMLTSGVVSGFVNRHPSVKMLALSFLLLIGMTLVSEGFGQHISKGYIYVAMGFSVFVEVLNLRSSRRKSEPVVLHGPVV